MSAVRRLLDDGLTAGAFGLGDSRDPAVLSSAPPAIKADAEMPNAEVDSSAPNESPTAAPPVMIASPATAATVPTTFNAFAISLILQLAGDTAQLALDLAPVLEIAGGVAPVGAQSAQLLSDAA